MNKINITVKKNIVYCHIISNFRFSKKNEFQIKYPIDISKVPCNIINFMCLFLLSEILSWNSGVFEVGELTELQLKCLEDHIRLNFIANPYGRISSDYAKLKCDRKVVGIKRDNPNGALCCNGMGKDGICITNIAKEINNNVRGFIESFRKT